MIAADMTRTIIGATAKAGFMLDIQWSGAIRATIDLSKLVKGRAFAQIREPREFAKVKVGDWGHSLEWPQGIELGADALWLMTLGALGRKDTQAFLEWRLRHGLSLSKAAEALGMSRRMVAYYSNGERPVPRAILLACKGWEVEAAA
jgi:hypothetical protein